MKEIQEPCLDPKPFGFDTWIDWAVSGNGLTHGNNGISWQKACELAKEELKRIRLNTTKLEVELILLRDLLNDVESKIYRAKDAIRMMRGKAYE